MSKRSEQPMAQRLRMIREAAGLTQLQFLPKLNAASRAVLGEGEREYSQSTLSKLESGAQEPIFDDVAVFAWVDPLKRGKLWLAWGESRDSATAETHEELAARLGVSPPRRKQQFPAPTATKKATNAGGQKRRPGR